jgi:hypothetical protein
MCAKDLHSPSRPLGWCPFSFALKPKSGFAIQNKMCNSIGVFVVFNIVIISVDGEDGKNGLSDLVRLDFFFFLRLLVLCFFRSFFVSISNTFSLSLSQPNPAL